MQSPDQAALRNIFPVTEWLHVPILSTIGAARSFDDLPVRSWIDILPPVGAKASDRFCGAVVNGDSLEDDHINEGDVVVFRLNFERSEIKQGALVAVWCPYGLLLKHIYYTMTGTVRLVSANPRCDDLVLDADDVVVQGIAVIVSKQIL